jgi:hypothetical protein
MSAPAVKPQFRHNCDRCIFLGARPGADFYFCPSNRGGGSVLARTSHRPHDYASIPSDLIRADSLFLDRDGDPLADAYDLAVGAGLLEDVRDEELDPHELHEGTFGWGVDEPLDPYEAHEAAHGWPRPGRRRRR